MPPFVLKSQAQCKAPGGPEGARCERRTGHDGPHMGSPRRNGKRVATDVVEWGDNA
jgi:hypothetical protein